MNKITKEETNWSPGIPGMFGTPLIDPHTFSSFPSTCVKDNQKQIISYLIFDSQELLRTLETT